MTAVSYCTREDVLAALDFQATTRDLAQIDRAVTAATRPIESRLRRVFYPWTGTRYKPWPAPDYSTSYRLWLDADELATVTTLVAGGVTIPSTDYFLEPNSGPPYTRIEINLAEGSVFRAGQTRQRAIAITGVWCGSPVDADPAGTLTAAISTTTATSCSVTAAGAVAAGVGSILLIDSERLIVTGRSWATTAETGSLTAVNNDQALAVANGTLYAVGETLMLDSERVLVTDITGNTLTVRRAVQGTTLAAHTSATIYAQRTFTVTRGALGTTAATHSSSTPVGVHPVPPAVRSLAVGEALAQLTREGSGYTSTARGKTLGAGGDSTGAAGAVTMTPLDDLRAAAEAANGRHGRTRAV